MTTDDLLAILREDEQLALEFGERIHGDMIDQLDIIDPVEDISDIMEFLELCNATPQGHRIFSFLLGMDLEEYVDDLKSELTDE